MSKEWYLDMEQKNGSVKRLVFLSFALFFCLFSLNACGFVDTMNSFQASDSELEKASDPDTLDEALEEDPFVQKAGSTVSNLIQKAKNGGEAISNGSITQGIEARNYVDEKTGQAVTKAQHDAYNATDTVKKYGIYIASTCFALGLLLRAFVKESVSIRRFGLALMLAVPAAYFVLAYVMSLIADKI